MPSGLAGVWHAACHSPAMIALLLLAAAQTSGPDLGGPIQGMPLPAYDMDTGTQIALYVVVRDVFGTTTDRLYVVDAAGAPDPAYAVPYVEVVQADGDIAGEVWWNTEAGAQAIYFGTTAGKLLRVLNDPAARALTVDWTFSYGRIDEVTSPVVGASGALIFGGLDGTRYRLFAVSIPAPSLLWSTVSLGGAVRGRPIRIDGSQHPLAPEGETLFAVTEHDGTAAHLYRINAATGAIDANLTASRGHDMTAWPDFTLDRIVVGDAGGNLHRTKLSGAAPFLEDDPGWPFAGGPAAIRGPAWRDTIGDYPDGNTNGLRIYYGDDDGRFHCTASAWAPLGSGEPRAVDPDGYGSVPAYPLTLEAGVPLRGFPQYWQGVVAIANTNGKIFMIDESQRAAIVTHDVGAGVALGDIGWDSRAFQYVVGGDDGRLYFFPDTEDPTP